jgi:CP family cyanate transporter-like MFS transporter
LRSWKFSVVALALVAVTSRLPVGSIPPMLDRLGLGEVAQSLLVTVPVLCFAAGGLAAVPLQGRLGLSRGIFVSTAAIFAGLLLRAAWPGWAMFPGTILAGMGAATLNVLLAGFVKERFPMRLGELTALYTTIWTVSVALAAGLTVPVLHATDSVGAALGIWAIPALLALLAWLPQLGVAERHRGDERAAGPRLRTLAGEPIVVALILFIAGQWLLYFGVFSWLAEIYEDRGLSENEAAFLLVVLNVVGLSTTLGVPVIAARMRDQRAAVSATVAVSVLGVAGFLLAPASSALAWATLFGLGAGAALGLAMLLLVLRTADSAAAGRVAGMALSSGYLLAAAGVLAVGWLHDLTGDWDASLVFLIVAGLASWLPGLRAARAVTVGEQPGGEGLTAAERQAIADR